MPAPEESGLRLDLLGPPVVTVDGAPLRVDTRKAVAVLAVLTFDGPQTRSGLAALLWPESDTARARGTLRRTLSVLARGLGDRWLVTDRERVLLDGPGCSSDVAEVAALRDLVDRHDEAPDQRCDACLDALQRAVALHRGDLLAGFGLRDSAEFDDWCALRAEAHRRTLCQVLDHLTRATLARRDLDGTLTGLQRWLGVDALDEQVHRRLMLVHAWRGERSEAIRRYRSCVATLDTELGVAPLPKTTALYREILADRVPVLAPAVPAVAEQPRPGPAPGPAARWPMVGRDAELAHLVAAYRRDAGLQVVTGEAGVGKTRLVDAWLDQVSTTGARIVRARSYPGESGLTFGPVVELLRQAAAVATGQELARLPTRTLAEAHRLAPALVAEPPPLPEPPPLDSPGARAVLFTAVWDTLEAALAGGGAGHGARGVRGVLVLDDLHAVDPSSWELISHGLRRLAERRLSVLVCLRPDEAPAGVTALLTELAEPVPLHRLPVAASAELVARVLGRDAGDSAAARRPAERRPAERQRAERLHAESEGLPLLLVEYLRLLADGTVDPDAAAWVPPREVRDLARSRLASLSEPARQLASTAAAIGRSFDLDVVRPASGRTEQEAVGGIEELVGCGLIREVPAGGTAAGTTVLGNAVRYDFVHDKLRAAIYDMTSLARRKLLHARLARVLATGAGRGPDRDGRAAVIGEHLARAHQDAQAAQWFVRAGAHARSLFANAEALAHFERAAGLGLASGPVRAAVGELRTLLGDYAGAILALEEAAALAGDDHELARAEHQLGTVHMRRGAADTAAAHLARARALAGRPSLAARVEADLGLLRLRTRDVDGADGHARRALDLATTADDVAARAQALNLLGAVARHRGRPVEAREHLERSAALAQTLADPAAQVAALNNLALATADAGDVESAIAVAHRAVRRGAEHGDRHREAALRNNLADLLHLAGRDDEARSALAAAVELFAGVDGAAQPQPEIWKLVDW